MQPPCSNKDLAKAYNAAYGEELAHYPTFFERRPDWLITMWLAANILRNSIDWYLL